MCACELADQVLIADDQLRRFSGVLEVLRVRPDGRELKNTIRAPMVVSPRRPGGSDCACPPIRTFGPMTANARLRRSHRAALRVNHAVGASRRLAF